MFINPRDPRIKKMTKNARYMSKNTFSQLCKNIQSDGGLESVPLLHTLETGNFEIISGHHRIDAAIAEKMEVILVMVIPKELDLSEKRAKQISHNAISGEDDKQILAQMWREIDGLEEKLYTGLDSVIIGEIENINFEGLNPETVRTEVITFWFLPEEVKVLDAVLERYQLLAGTNQAYMVPMKKYDKLFQAIVRVKQSKNIKNTAVAFSLLIDDIFTLAEKKYLPPENEETGEEVNEIK